MTNVHAVYIDESGTHSDSPTLALAAYVFKEKQAGRFSKEWQRDLQIFGLPFAHMTDCATGNGHYASLTLQQRIDSEKALIAHIRHRSLFGVSIGVDYAQYRDLFGKGRYEHDAYTFCIVMCLLAIDDWARRTGYSGKFHYYFESGHAAQSEANDVMKTVVGTEHGASYSGHSFLDKAEAIPLQAADMLAWQWAHYLRRRGEKGVLARRKDFDALMRPNDQLAEVTSEGLKRWRKLMDEQNEEILLELSKMPGITAEDLAYAASQARQRS
ncbi:DUF3800 domain-containing protein [Rhizobium redzepovicii]|uniref:DUF3800 domain-containing protein n=1 Tax=Rhizobium redzepovicii TaxID=2867518 RepID=UPI002870BB1E|nr:DUF3800 domain-containing protein [Rhizobium redzepovicii]MDR9781844.1 DUF3800 domain-containing protein [Rhizobium redzepovicii]